MDSERLREELSRALRLSGLMLAAACLAARATLTSHTGPSLGGATMGLLTVMLAGVTMAFVLVRGEIRVPRTPLLLAVGAAVAVVAVTALLAPHRAAAVDVLEAWFVYAVVTVAILVLAERPSEARFVVAAVVATAAVASAYGIFQRYVGFVTLRQEVLRRPESYEELRLTFGGSARLASNRVFGAFVLPNSLAGYLGVALPAVLAFLAAWLRGPRRALRAAAILATLLAVLWCLMLTGSRGGAASAGLGVAAFLCALGWPRLRRSPRATVAAALGAAAVALLLVMVLPESDGLAGRLKRSLSVRANYWKAAASMARQHPMGVGPGGFGDSYPRHKVPTGWETKHPHNIYLNWLTETGIAGLAALLFLLSAAAACAPDSGREEPRPGAPPPPADMVPGAEAHERKLRDFGLIAAAAAFLIIYVGPGALESEAIGRLAAGMTGETLRVPASPRADAAVAGRGCVAAKAVGGILSERETVNARKLAELREAGVTEIPVYDPDKRSGRTALTAAVHILFPVLWCAVFAAAYSVRLSPEALGAAVIGGTAAFAAHGLVDVDDTVPGIVVTLLGLSAAGAVARAAGGEDGARILSLGGRRGYVASTAFAILLSGAVVLGLYPSTVTAIAIEGADPVIKHGPASDLPGAITGLLGAAEVRDFDDRLHAKLYQAFRKISPMVEPSEAARLEAEATAHARRWAALNPRSFVPREQLGHWLMGRGEHAGALAAYRSAAELYPTKPLEWFYLGDAQILAGAEAEGVASYVRAASVDRAITDDRCLLANAAAFRYFAAYRSAEAERRLHGRIARLIGSRSGEARRALVLRAVLLRVVEFHNPVIRGGIAGAVERGRSLMRAAELIESELPRLGSDPQALLMLGAVHRAAGDDRACAERWEEAWRASASAPEGRAMRPEVMAAFRRRAELVRAASRPAGGPGGLEPAAPDPRGP